MLILLEHVQLSDKSQRQKVVVMKKLVNLKHYFQDIFSEVKEIDLKGCFLLTDHGIQCLLEKLTNTKQLTKVCIVLRMID